ncbi:MAG: SDR family oxidoreductase, partial [Planctomycetota bacterium]
SAAASVGMHPVGRLGESQDIASAIHWFLQPENSWVTGQNLAVDGGLSGLKTMAR